MYAPTSWLLLVLLVLLVCGLGLCDESDPLIVRTNKGRIRGFTSAAATGKRVDSWLGIPYAQPPYGLLRFRPPQPIASWDSILNTTHLPNSCVQEPNILFGDFSGTHMWNANTLTSEDCLYLNVVVPKPRPLDAVVMVWIHGGGFYSGTSTLDLYNPKTLVSEQNVIVVSLQYRVSNLGFLFFDTPDVPGNAGLLDQLMALQWVHDNIAAFGGDPDKVTLFGEGAGAASVSMHLLSPLSRPLFRSAILQSGSATVPWAIVSREESIARGLFLAEAVSCPHNRSDIPAVIECLLRKPAMQLVENEWNSVYYFLQYPYVPVVDGNFLVESPQESLLHNNFKNTSLLVGSNLDEGNFFLISFLADLLPREENVSVSRDQYVHAIGEIFQKFNEEVRREVEVQYAIGMDPEDSKSYLDALDKMTGDFGFTCSVNEYAHSYAQAGNDVFSYLFKRRSRNHPWPLWTGVMHGDEIAYVFGQPLDPAQDFTHEEKELSRTMMEYWANFARTGNPGIREDGAPMAHAWPKHTSLGSEYLSLDVNIGAVGKGPRQRQCAFWKDQFPILMNPTNMTETD